MDVMSLPVSHFVTTEVPEREQFGAWRESHRLMFDMKPAGEVEPAPFPAAATTYQIGGLLFGHASYASCRFERDERRAAEGLDMVMVRLNLDGEHRGDADGLPVAARAGDIDIIDLLRPLSYESSGSSVLVLGIPGRVLATMISERSMLHGFVTRASSGMGAILGDYLRSLYARAGAIQVSEAAGVASATTSLVATCLGYLLRPHASRALDARATLLESIKDHIEKRLRSDDLTVEHLCEAFGLSRASLYRLFAPLGGVARYIRDRRLVAAFVALSDRGRSHEAVSSIAFELKFASEAHFGRIFRAAFKCTPGQLRSDALSNGLIRGDDAPISRAPAYIGWLERLAMRDR